jgi:hypothetical protein
MLKFVLVYGKVLEPVENIGRLSVFFSRTETMVKIPIKASYSLIIVQWLKLFATIE